MVNPADGLLGKAKFLPSLAEVKQWLEDQVAVPSRAYPLLPPVEDKPEDAPEVKAAAVERWNRAKSEMTLPADQIAPERTRWKQVHNPDALLASLENLERAKDLAAPPNRR